MRIKLAIISVAVSVLMVSGLAVAGGPGPKATGMGTALKTSGKTAEFNFNVPQAKKKGKVSVRVENDDDDGSLNQEFSGNVDCYFQVGNNYPQDGNTAYISGKVKELERGTNRFDGKNFLIKAVDNGSDDRFDWHRRTKRRGGPFDCKTENPDRDFPVIEGEITVYAG